MQQAQPSSHLLLPTAKIKRGNPHQEVSPEPRWQFTPTERDQALSELEAGRVRLLRITDEGVLHSQVTDARSGRAYEETITLLASGGFLVQQSLTPPGDSSLRIRVLASLLALGQLLSKKRRSAAEKRLLQEAPKWLVQGFKFSLTLLSDLQAYWFLREMVNLPKLHLERDVLVKHLFSRYSHCDWKIQIAAMEAILRRMTSAQNEAIKLTPPPGNQVLGFYRAKNYRILVAQSAPSTGGIDASCDCPDFLKNTLKLCKHICAVVLHWDKSNAAWTRFLEAKPPTTLKRIKWVPPIEMEPYCDPIAGIQGLCPARLAPPSDPSKRFQQLNEFLQALKIQEKSSKQVWIDPAIWPVLAAEIEKLKWPLELPRHRAAFKKALHSLKFKLYPYQKEGISRALEQGKFLLADDMGLGKTVQAIGWAESLLSAGVAKRVLLVCPAALKSQWRREWQNVTGREIHLIEGSPTERAKFYKKAPAVCAINYELFIRDVELILAMAPDAVILDEAQRIKNYATETAQQIKRLRAPFRLVLTGTPMENRIQELASLMDWVDSTAMGPQWRLPAQFQLGDARAEDHSKHGVRGLSWIRSRIGPHMIRRIRSEVLGDLPPRTDTLVPLEITEEQKSVHDEYARKTAQLASIAERRPLTPAEHLRLMTLLTKMRITSNGMALHDFAELWPSLQIDPKPEARIHQLNSPKLLEFRNLVEGLLTQPKLKIVIFSQWERMLRLAHWSVSDLLAREGTEAVFFSGKESQKQRTENIVRFHDDDDVRLFLSTDAGGVGLNLQKAGQVCINLELPWNPAVLEQRIGRIYRMGQTQPVQIYNLVTQNCIEERITSLVAQKRAVFQGLFEGQSDEVIFERTGSFYSQVRNVMDELKIKPAPTDTPDSAEDQLTVEAVDEAVAPLQAAESPILNTSDVQSLQAAFQNLKVSRTEGGGLRLEAEGNSAQLLAGVFRGLADLFEAS
ncbi:DEAD/DEAH box helicase [Bdellovibrionota bacterium FG-1]